MRRLLFVAFLAGTLPVAARANQGADGMSGGDFLIARGGAARATIVVEQDAGRVAQFAARELQSYLNRVTGAFLPVVAKLPVEEVNIIVLGHSRLSRQHGVAVDSLKRDGFIIRRAGRHLFLAGRDDRSFDLQSYVECRTEPPHYGHGWRDRHGTPECATAFAVYSFLERAAGVRWYFPGPMGEIVPHRPDLSVGAVDVADEPAMVCRWNKWDGGTHAWPGDFRQWRMTDYVDMKLNDRDATLWGVRNRRSTLKVPMNHMPLAMWWVQRFGKEHPEYFGLLPDGERSNGSGADQGHLCYSNPDVRRIVAEDVDACFSGKEPTEIRNAISWFTTAWSENVANESYFSLLPRDSSKGCQCDRCLAARLDALNCGEQSPLVWGYFREIAERTLGKHPDKRLVCLAYGQTRAIPPGMKPLPENLLVGATAVYMGDSGDNATMRRIVGEIRKWRTLTPNKLVLWTYYIVRPQYNGIPQTQARAMGRFFREIKDDVQGICLENLMTHGYQHHLDLYIHYRLLWNPEADVDALMREYAALMYGPAAAEILEIYAITEDKWINGIARHDREQMRGAAYQDIIDIPTERWEDGVKGLTREVYTPAVLEQLSALVEKIRQKNRVGPYKSRTDLFVERFWEPLRKACMQNAKVNEPEAGE